MSNQIEFKKLLKREKNFLYINSQNPQCLILKVDGHNFKKIYQFLKTTKNNELRNIFHQSIKDISVELKGLSSVYFYSDEVNFIFNNAYEYRENRFWYDGNGDTRKIHTYIASAFSSTFQKNILLNKKQNLFPPNTIIAFDGDGYLLEKEYINDYLRWRQNFCYKYHFLMETLRNILGKEFNNKFDTMQNKSLSFLLKRYNILEKEIDFWKRYGDYFLIKNNEIKLEKKIFI